MRDLTQVEIDVALDDNGEADEGCVAIETTVGELAALGAQTVCGESGNCCFAELAKQGFADRFARGWFYRAENEVWGMFHIECADEAEAEAISEIAYEGGGSLRPSGKSLWGGFWEFEIE